MTHKFDDKIIKLKKGKIGWICWLANSFNKKKINLGVFSFQFLDFFVVII